MTLLDRTHGIFVLVGLFLLTAFGYAQESKAPGEAKEMQKANLVISSGPLFDFGRIIIGETVENKFRITNIGNKEADDIKVGRTSLVVPFTFTGGVYPGREGNCSSAIKPGAHCIVDVTFSPMMAGEFNSTLSIEYFNGQAIVNTQRPLRATAVAPALLHLKEVGHHNFGDKIIGTLAEQVFMVANVGGMPSEKMDLPDLEKPFTLEEENCEKVLQPGEACKLSVRFTPKISSSWKQNLKLTYTDGRRAQVLFWEIQGRGMTPSALAVVGESRHDFETEVIGNTKEHTFTLKNHGEVAATSMALLTEGENNPTPFQFKGGQYPGTGGSCSELIGGGESCKIVLTFVPKVPDSFKKKFLIQYANGLSQQTIEIVLKGKAITPANLAFVEGSLFDFGQKIVGETTEHSLYLTNLGQATAQAISPSVLTTPLSFKGGQYPGTHGSCAPLLKGGDKCKLTFSLFPTASGKATNPLEFSYHDGTKNQKFAVSIVSFSKTRARLAFIGNAQFSPILANQGTKATFEVVNSGELDAEKVDIDRLNNQFTFSGGNFPGLGGNCTNRVASGGKCRVSIDFGPEFPGVYHTVLSAEYFDGVKEVFLSMRLTASAVTRARLAITGSANFETQKQGAFLVRLFKVVNAGHTEAKELKSRSLDDGYTYEGGGYPGTNGTCKQTLAAGETCHLAIAFFPKKPGIYPTTLSLRYFDGGENQTTTLALSGFSCPASIQGQDRVIASECQQK